MKTDQEYALRRLAAAARADRPPPLDVTERVMDAILAPPVATAPWRALYLLESLSAAAAVVAAMVAAAVLHDLCDPLTITLYTLVAGL